MTRYLCWLALLGVMLVPDWANAYWFRWRANQATYTQPIYPVSQTYPVMPAYPVSQAYPSYPSYPSYPVCVPVPVCVCPPDPGSALPPPRVERTPRMANPAPAPAPAPSSGLGTAIPKPMKPPTVETVRPAGGSDTIPPQVVPAAPTTKKADPPKVVPEPIQKLPEVTLPKDTGALPKLDVPKEPDFRPIPNPKDASPNPSPIPGASVGGTAVPTPAPAFPEPLIPSPSVPALPDPKKQAELPSLTLPPDSPVAPPKNSTSRSSPVTRGTSEPTAEVFAASGTGNLAGGYKAVGFYNHTDRDLNLVIEGRSVKLPAKSYLHAQLAPSFTWGHAGATATRETVPAGSSGVDVVFRD